MIKLRVFDMWEKFLYSGLGPLYRSFGQNMNFLGVKIQGDMANDDRRVPSLRCIPQKGAYPHLGLANFVAPNSTILGNISLGLDASIWYGSVLRGDSQPIKIGKSSVIQDLAIVAPSVSAIEIGDNVYVGPNTYLESCVLQSHAFVGMGASLHKGVKVESYGVVAAGAVVKEDTTIPSYQIWAGSPAKYLRDLTNEEKEVLDEFHEEIVSLAKIHSEEAEKDSRDIIDELDTKTERMYYNPEQWAATKAKELGFPMEPADEDFMEQRIFMREHEPSEDQHWKKNYDPYEQDLYHFPDSFKIYGENHGKYEELKKYFDENPTAKLQTMEREQRVPPRDDEPWTKRW